MKMRILFVILGLFVAMPTASKAASTVTVPTSASIDALLELEATIFEGDVADGAITSAMNFGRLVSDEPGGALRGDTFFNVQLVGRTSARAYQIVQTGTPLTSGTNSLPAGACVFTPHTNGTAAPAGSTLGARRSWIQANNTLIYGSDPAGTIYPAFAAYAIANDPAQGATEFVTEGQPSGTYAGTVTFTLTLI